MENQSRSVEFIIEDLQNALLDIAEAKDVINVASRRATTLEEAKNGRHTLRNASVTITHAIKGLKEHI